MRREKAILAAGCFWGVESTFRKLEGVISTRVGYTGGDFDNPTYEDVCSHKTGHAEAVEITYDADVISYEELLDVFWNAHNPTTPNRQGWDVGSQYRSAIFYLNEEQKQKALESKRKIDASGKFRKSIVTEITAASEFWEAEEYHQQYHEKQRGFHFSL